VNTNCCTWEGVTCDSTSGHVTGLDLSSLCISGNLSSSDIFKLTSLHSLNLSYNNFDESPWPNPGFEQLTELKYLDLSYSGLSGALPVENGQLSSLVALNLSGLDLKDLNLETLIDSLGSLQELYLEDVNISISSTNFAHASSTNTTSGLKELAMGWCTITSGRLDTVLTKLPFLSKLTLDGTNISGPTPVPKIFVEFSSLAVLSLISCGLTGTFPSWIFCIKSLISLDVSENENLCGELPEFIEGSALQILLLSGTKFSGKIPESISNLRNLTLLVLSDCQFHGLIPSFAQWPMIRRVDLSDNNLTGSLPSDGYLSLHKLTEISLGNNLISGAIPASLFSHSSLEFLDLSQNNFTGNFLLYPNVSSTLVWIDVSFNKLQGPLPKLLAKFVRLEVLDLSSNNLTGTVDVSFIKNCKKLQYLSLSYNKLSVVEEDGNHSYFEYPLFFELGVGIM